jgi:hypothetical protein
MRLFHFSDDPAIDRFEPRPVLKPSPRSTGREWLNGPLVWAIDDWHQPMYLFPRECPRILIWPTAESSAADLEAWWAGRDCRMIAHIERRWLETLQSAHLHRYELPPEDFENLDDAGMWGSRATVAPLARNEIRDLPAALAAADVELRILESLAPLRDVWSSTLHASGIRLRNAVGWPG